MKIYKTATCTIAEGIRTLSQFLEDPNLKYLSCVHNAKKHLAEGDFYRAVKALRVDCDKIRMINEELYNYIGNIAIPATQDQVDRWWQAWKRQEGKR